LSLLRETSRIWTSTTISARRLSTIATMRSAAATGPGVVDGEGVRPGQGGDAAGPEDDAQEVDRLLEVGVREEERLDHLLLELPPLGGGVGHHVEDLRVTTRWNVRPAAARAFSAWSKPTSLRSSDTTSSRKDGSKVMLIPAARPRAR